MKTVRLVAFCCSVRVGLFTLGRHRYRVSDRFRGGSGVGTSIATLSLTSQGVSEVIQHMTKRLTLLALLISPLLSFASPVTHNGVAFNSSPGGGSTVTCTKMARVVVVLCCGS